MYDKIIIQIVVASTFLFVVFAVFLVMFTIRYNKGVLKLNLEKQRLLFDLENKELSMGFQERELVLEEVSKDIHDNIGQLAHLIRMNLFTIEEYSDNPEQLEVIQYVSELTDRVISDTKYIGHSLNCNFIKGRGLYRMLEYDLEKINASRQIKCFIDIEGEAEGHCITAEAQLLVYRIAQEAIHNVLQHANACNLEMQLVYHRGNFKMVIRDDGIGFDELAAEEKGMMGLVNMRQRAKLLNAELQIDTKPDNGCSISLYCKDLLTTHH